MTVSVNRRYIPEIDQLRAFAALLVLFYRGLQLIGTQLAQGTAFDPSRHWLYPANPVLTIIEEGHSGVSLFIVLSGFILSLGAVGNSVSYGRFLAARILRIYPMFVLCLMVAHHLSGGAAATFFTSLLPLNASGGTGTSFTFMFWAVAVEFQCYLLFPLLIAFSNERGSKFLVQLIAVALLIRLLAVLAEGANPRDLSYWTVVGRIDQFCIGMIAARLYVERDLANIGAKWFVPSALAAGLMLCVFNRLGGWPSAPSWKIGWPTIEGAVWACFIVSYLPAARRLMPNWFGRLFAKLGEISYSMYLLHFAVIFAIIKNGWYVRVTGNGYYDALATTLLAALPATAAMSLLTYNTIELPFLRMRPRYIVPARLPDKAGSRAA